MGNVKVIHIWRDEEWVEVAEKLKEKGVDVSDNPSGADVCIVLGGKFVNPAILKGKKILFFDVVEWLPNVPKPHGFNVYYPVLSEYYDAFVNCSAMSDNERIKEILHEIEEHRS